MENEFELGKSYTVEILLQFLLEIYRQNIFLVTVDDINVLSLPLGKKYFINKIQPIFLYRSK
jgi:hypothetical protein